MPYQQLYNTFMESLVGKYPQLIISDESLLPHGFSWVRCKILNSEDGRRVCCDVHFVAPMAYTG
jgi:hypothetical protein